MKKNGLFAYSHQTGQFVDPERGQPLTLEAIHGIENYVHALADRRDAQARALLAGMLIGPIFTVAKYEAWTSGFWMSKSASPGEYINIPQWSYTGFAVLSAPLGAPVYDTVIGRLYAQPSWSNIAAAVATDWDTLAYAGWDYLSRAIRETAWEMARQKDLLASAVLTTASTSISSHAPTVATTMTKASVDLIFKAQARIGFPVRYVVINRGTVMDMLSWVWPASNGMWQFNQPDKMGEAFSNLWVSGYGGATWVLSKDVPTNSVYFVGAPENGGYEFITPVRETFHQDIEHHLDKYAWDFKVAYRYENAYNLQILTIT